MLEVVRSEDRPAIVSPSADAPISTVRRPAFRLTRLLPICLLLLTVAILFSPLYSAEFMALDDAQTVYRNRRINSPTWSSIRAIWTTTAAGLYIPVTYTIWAGLSLLSRAIFPLEPTVHPTIFHTFNVLTHAATCVVVYRILRLFVASRWAAVGGAALFALHPVQVESVAWVSGLKDLLWGFFGTLSLLHYLLSVRDALPADAAERGAFVSSIELNRRRSWVHFALATLFFLIALLCKPTAMIMPVLAGVVDLFLVRRRWQSVLRSLWIWVLLAVPAIVATKMIQDVPYQDGIPIWARPLIATDSLAYYLTKLAIPTNLTFDPGRRPDWTWASGAPLYTWILPVAVALFIYWRRRRYPWVVAGSLVFLVGVLPVLGLVPFMFQYVSTVASHYLYVSMLGPAMIAAMWLRIERRALVVGLYVALIAFLGIRSTIESTYWHDSLTYYERMVEINPKSFFGHDGLGYAFEVQGDKALAAAYFSKAIEIYPDFSISHHNLGYLLIAIGNQNRNPDLILRGLHHVKQSIDLRGKQPTYARPLDVKARLIIARIYDQMGLRAEAEEQWRKVIEENRDPDTIAEARERLANPTTRPTTLPLTTQPSTTP